MAPGALDVDVVHRRSPVPAHVGHGGVVIDTHSIPQGRNMDFMRLVGAACLGRL